jgi:ribonuclease HI
MSFHNLLTIYKHAILPVITYASEAWYTTTTKRARSKLLQIQRSYLIYITKAYRTVSNEALSAIAGLMPLDLVMLLHKDKRATSQGQPTNAIIPELKKIEFPNKIRNTHPKDNHIRVDLAGTEGTANVSIYTDGCKTEHHVGASMVAMENSIETHTETQRLHISCTVFQAELCGIIIAVEWIQRQRRKSTSYAINVDSKTALSAIASKRTTHPLAFATRKKTIELGKSTSLTFHWVKGHAGLRGNERADYLAKTAVSYNTTTIAYNATPINRGKQLLEEHYKTIHTHHPPQPVPLPMAKFHPHAILN